MSAALHGGTIYFHVSKNGKDMTAEKVSNMSGKTRDAFHRTVYYYFNTHKPAGVTHFQVEMEDYGSMISFAASRRISDFSLPEMHASVGGARYIVTFDPFINDEEEENNTNKNGGGAKKRSVRRRTIKHKQSKHRRNTRKN